MKLAIQNRIKMPDEIRIYIFKSNIVLSNGQLILLGVCEDHFCLVTLKDNQLKYKVLDDLGERFSQHHYPTLLALDADSFGLLAQGDTLYRYQDLDVPPEIIQVENHQILFHLQKVPRITSYRVVGEANCWFIILNERSTDNPKYLASLHVDLESKRSRWDKLIQLNPKEFPPHMKFFYEGKEIFFPPDIGGTMVAQEDVYVFVEGSDRPSIPRYGSDYYSLAKVDQTGKVIEKLWEAADLKELPGKHGVEGCFSSSRQYVILNPVFNSGPWKGKPKLFDLAAKTLIDVEMPRGSKNFRIIDHGAERFYLSDGRNEIMICGEV